MATAQNSYTATARPDPQGGPACIWRLDFLPAPSIHAGHARTAYSKIPGLSQCSPSHPAKASQATHMSKLTPSHLAILKSLSAQHGPVPVDQLSGLPASGAALEADLDHLASRGFLTRTGKATALTEVGQAALSEAPTKATGKAKCKPASAPATQPSEEKPAKPTKKARLIALLTVETGVTVPDLAARLGWLPHTTRAALTGLRNNGYTVDKLPPLEGSRSSRYKLVEAC